jgi:hypothetical protein
MTQGHEGMSQGHVGAVRGRAVGPVEGMQRAQAGGMDPSALPKIVEMIKAALAQAMAQHAAPPGAGGAPAGQTPPTWPTAPPPMPGPPG